MADVNFNFDDMRAFFARVRAAGAGDFEKALGEFLEGLGFEFLRIVQDEIIRREVVDTRLLLNSFEKGDSDGVWVISEDGFSLEVGTNVSYAAYVNDGHWTNPKGVERRFVPGDVVTDSNGKVIQFTYRKGAHTGIMLKQRWVEGSHYWEWAIRTLERIAPQLLDAKLQEWLNSYFKDFI